MAGRPVCVHRSIVDWLRIGEVEKVLTSAIPVVQFTVVRQNCKHGMETTETQSGHHWSLTLLGMALVVMFAYYGESVLAVMFFAILLSFMLSPVVQALEYLHLPRALAALISVVVLLAVLYGVTAASYNQAIIFADNVPKYSQKIRSILQPFRQEAEKLEKRSG